MIKNAALALALPGLVVAAAPAFAAPASHSAAYAHSAVWADQNADHGRGRHRGYERSNDRYYGGGNYAQSYNGYNTYNGYNGQTWRGNDGRYYCKRSNGTTGLLIGGAAGALLGREIAGRNGDRTLGAILGAAGGALLGREVTKGPQCR